MESMGKTVHDFHQGEGGGTKGGLGKEKRTFPKNRRTLEQSLAQKPGKCLRVRAGGLKIINPRGADRLNESRDSKNNRRGEGGKRY